MISLMAALTLIGGAQVVRADPIQITGGSLQMNPTSGPLILIGDRGFTFQSGFDVVGNIFLPWEECNVSPLQCTPGKTLDLTARGSGNDLTGTATLDGVTYTDVGALGSPNSMSVAFQGTLVLPPIGSADTTVTAPFSFSGQFLRSSETDDLVGGGTATLLFSPSVPFPGSWHLDGARYDLAPTPEPGSLLLMGSGLVTLTAWCRRGNGVRNRRRDSGRSPWSTSSPPGFVARHLATALR
jgi:hypothetical protein